MKNVCFGYLVAPEHQHCAVVEKFHQLARLYQSNLAQNAPHHTATTIDELIRWAHNTGCDYLYVQSPGALTTNPLGLNILINKLGNDSTIGNHLSPSGYWTKNTTILLVNLVTNKLNAGHDIPPEAYRYIENLNIHQGIEQLDKTLFTNFSNRTNLINQHQYFFILKHHKEEDYITPLEDPNTKESLFLNPQYEEVLAWTNPPCQATIPGLQPIPSLEHTTCRKLQVEVGKLFAVPRGFRPFQILHQKGFNAGTHLVFFDANEAALHFYQTLLTHWNGINFPDFMNRSPYIRAYAFDTQDYSRIWQKALETFGGERAFKVLWDRAQQLRRSFMLIDVKQADDVDNLFNELTPDSQAYLYWGNSFSDVRSHLRMWPHELAQSFSDFINGARARNPMIRLEGNDHWGEVVQ